MLHAAPLGHLAPWLPSRSGLYIYPVKLILVGVYTPNRHTPALGDSHVLKARLPGPRSALVSWGPTHPVFDDSLARSEAAHGLDF